MHATPHTYGLVIESIDTPDETLKLDNSRFNAPYLDITLATSIDDDQGRALFDQAIQEEGSVRLVAGERSGWARFGVETVADLQSIEEDGKAISMRARIIAISKLAQQGGLNISIL